MFNAGVKANVIPHEAKAVINQRINIGETVESVMSYNKKLINDPRVEMRVVLGSNPSHVSTCDSEGFKFIERSIRQVCLCTTCTACIHVCVYVYTYDSCQ